MASGRVLSRGPEQARLERAWAAATGGQPQLAVDWGQRRVGETFLLAHFVRRKRAVFFGATQQAEGVELGRLAEAVRRDLGDRVADLAGGAFATGPVQRGPPPKASQLLPTSWSARGVWAVTVSLPSRVKATFSGG